MRDHLDMTQPQSSPGSPSGSVWSAPTADAPVRSIVPVPGSKSITNRALLLAALAEKPSLIRAPLRSRDTRLMAGALAALGVGVADRGADWFVTPAIPRGPAEVDCGLAGTVMRFVPPAAVLATGDVRFDGDPRARQRPMATVLDPTLWSYDPSVTSLYRTVNLTRHMPFGFGNIWQQGGPLPAPTREIIEIAGLDQLSADAIRFLDIAAPDGLDFIGWSHLASSPTGGWPSGEIIEAMHNTPRLTALISIDILGHVTDVNPSGAYMAGEEKA